MKLELVIQGPAADEIEDAWLWYENERTGLGLEFLAEINETLRRIADNPGQFPVIERNARRALVNRFPYEVFFLARSDRVLIISCHHAKRDPEAWRARL